MPPEILRAEILDWWEAEQERISRILTERIIELHYEVDQKIADMPIKSVVRRRSFYTKEIEPIIVD